MSENTSTTSPAVVRRAPARRTRPYWPAGTALVVLGLLPILARRLAAIAGEGAPAPDTLPLLLPVIVHAGAALVYVVLAPLQFSTRFRRRRPRWHRIAGRVLIVAGLAVALSGLWLAQIHALTDGAGLLYVFRLFFGLAMVFSIVWGFRAILRRDIAGHRVWMVRAYAIGLGAGTQLFTLGFGQALFGRGELSEALLTGAGWVINLGVAELLIRRGRRPARGVPVRAAAARGASRVNGGWALPSSAATEGSDG